MDSFPEKPVFRQEFVFLSATLELVAAAPLVAPSPTL
jgi:hypothetical protein